MQKKCSEQDDIIKILRKNLNGAQRDMLEAKREKEEAQSKERLKYQAEVGRLQSNVKSLEESKAELHEKLKNAEHEDAAQIKSASDALYADNLASKQ
ncbi:hypothetical protein KFL_000320460 [Klebsormidium nitens]|uniref:Uncharacterized protein n=1 Tax=Klebsormidium nitens TaxID=105231 RepID=A0A1Y1HUL7_KLENI|nr:hypothetical protein KFL_000320460 [Klebsormidium nitens]|eukprot:GAQ79548.1 hypothetical protein KFL_000320460 [Klebsormidium nitens]